MRIKRHSYYVLQRHPGLSGFTDWRGVESVIVSGFYAANHRTEVVGEYLARGLGRFRIHNGRLPEFQPIVSEVEALRYLDTYPSAQVSLFSLLTD